MPSLLTSPTALQWNGAEDISVCVTDPTEGDQPRGKQSRKPEGIFYTTMFRHLADCVAGAGSGGLH